MDDQESIEALSKVGADLHFFLERCVYLAGHPEVPTPVGAEFRWDTHGILVFQVLTGAILEVWARSGGRNIWLPNRDGMTVELELLLAREPAFGPGRDLLLRASSKERLDQVGGGWLWSLAFTGASINAACPP